MQVQLKHIQAVPDEMKQHKLNKIKQHKLSLRTLCIDFLNSNLKILLMNTIKINNFQNVYLRFIFAFENFVALWIVQIKLFRLKLTSNFECKLSYNDNMAILGGT